MAADSLLSYELVNGGQEEEEGCKNAMEGNDFTADILASRLLFCLLIHARLLLIWFDNKL